MIRRRSSSRCSRKLMAGRPSCDSSPGGSSAAISGIGGLGQRDSVGCRDGNLRGEGRGRRLRNRPGPRTGGRMVCGCFRYRACEISDSICALNSLEARLNSLRARPTCRPISGNFLGPKRIKGQKEQENHLWETQIHGVMILPENCQQSRREANGKTCRIPNLLGTETSCHSAASIKIEAIRPLLCPLTGYRWSREWSFEELGGRCYTA